MTQVAISSDHVGSAPIQGELWSVRARDYADVQEPTFLPLYRSVLNRPELRDAGTLLDIGCGPGLAAQTLGQKIGKVSGIDASKAFIEIARARTPKGDFRVAEMEAVPHADHSFDVVTGFNAFQYAASPIEALREARRLAKSAGLVVIAVWGLPETCDAAGHLKALGPLMPPPPAGAPGPFALSDEAKLKEFAMAAGLTPIDIVDVPCPWIYPDLDTALRGMLSAGAVERAIRYSGTDRAREAIVNSITPYRQPSGEYHLNNKFRYLVARA